MKTGAAVLAPWTLASSSPRRKEILERIGLVFEVAPPCVDERPAAGEPPATYAQRMARAKALAGGANPLRKGTIIGCDTVVAVGSRIIGKPSSPEDAREILSFLSGKEQQVISGLCLLHLDSGEAIDGHAITRVYTRPMSMEEIMAYVDTGEGLDKAGAYAIQETGDRFIEHIEGSFDNVVGFPTELFQQFIEALSRRINDGKER